MNRLVCVVIAIVVSASGAAAGQDRAQQPAQPAAQPGPAPVKGMAPTARLQVVLSRFNGDKRVANQPYVVVTVANGSRKLLRVGAEVPIGSGAGAGTKENPGYKSVGTNIRADVTLYDDGRYLVNVNVESSSPYADAQEKAGRPAFRNFNLDGAAYLKDGQTAEIATATDNITGEVIKMEVTVTSVK